MNHNNYCWLNFFSLFRIQYNILYSLYWYSRILSHLYSLQSILVQQNIILPVLFTVYIGTEEYYLTCILYSILVQQNIILSVFFTVYWYSRILSYLYSLQYIGTAEYYLICTLYSLYWYSRILSHLYSLQSILVQ